MKEQTFADWIRMGVFSSAFVAFMGVLILRLGLRLSWSELAVPLMLFAALQTVFFGAMFWFRRTRSVRIGAVVLGAYFAASFSILVHYASLWRLSIGLGPDDLRQFIIFLFALVIAVVVMPRRWTDSLWAGSVKCVRCHHYHEGHDCGCGCRVDQFKWPSIGSGFP
jgi:hypothetical protein